MPINYNNYPPHWPELRQQTLERDGYQCKHCGVGQYAVGYRLADDGQFVELAQGWTALEAKVLKDLFAQRYPKLKLIIIILTVAHLDHDEWNHEVQIERLAALCQRCHLQYDRVDNENRKKYGKQYRRYQRPLFAHLS